MGISTITNDLGQHVTGRSGRVFNLVAVDAYYEAAIVPVFDRVVTGHGMSQSAIALLMYDYELGEGQSLISTIREYDSEDGSNFTLQRTIYDETFVGAEGGSTETVFRQVALDWSQYRRYVRHINTLELTTDQEDPPDYVRGALIYAVGGLNVTGDI